ncbi:MAG TPA: hypothetical protein VNQ77_11105 [Frankiaceae bacterium]|nr:hypothetical protein [Frankiaceae bacterium]
MRRLAALALMLTALPLAPASAADPLLTTYVVERTTSAPAPLTIRGGAGAHDGEYTFAAVASATSRGGRLVAAEGALFFGLAPDSELSARTPAADVECKDVPVVSGVCAGSITGGGIAFVVWWDEPAFNRAFLVLRGVGKSMDLGEDGSPGWRVSRWTGSTRVVTDADMASAGSAMGRGAGVFGSASAPGAVGGSVAIGSLPCENFVVGAGAGAATLTGGTKDAVATCADSYPPAAASPGSTEWVFEGASAGVAAHPARLVVIQAPAS